MTDTFDEILIRNIIVFNYIDILLITLYTWWDFHHVLTIWNSPLLHQCILDIDLNHRFCYPCSLQPCVCDKPIVCLSLIVYFWWLMIFIIKENNQYNDIIHSMGFRRLWDRQKICLKLNCWIFSVLHIVKLFKQLWIAV